MEKQVQRSKDLQLVALVMSAPVCFFLVRWFDLKCGAQLSLSLEHNGLWDIVCQSIHTNILSCYNSSGSKTVVFAFCRLNGSK